MKFLPILLVLMFSSCASKKSGPQIASPDLYMKLNQLHQPKHQACIKQREEVLVKAISEASEAELDDEYYFFPRSEQVAATFLTKFDLSKFTLKENQQENEAIIMACVTPVSKSYKSCDTLNQAFKYFRGLIYGLRQYNWSPKTKELAIKQTMKYLEYVGESQSSLMEIFYANDLLMRLSDQGFVPTTLYQETVGFRQQGELVHKELRKIIKKLGKKELSCADAQDFYREERKKVIELSKNFLVLLRNSK